jgi:hypothetical protein
MLLPVKVFFRLSFFDATKLTLVEKHLGQSISEKAIEKSS